MSGDINAEGFIRYGGDCTCGAIYTYGGHAEPGSFDPFCPDHGEGCGCSRGGRQVSDVVARAKAALEGVTEGPWTWTHGMDARAMVLGPDNLRVKLEGYRDAEFIAQARTLVPELVAEVERLRAEKLGLEISESNLLVELRNEVERLRKLVGEEA